MVHQGGGSLQGLTSRWCPRRSTHAYESKWLTKAFEEITGIHVVSRLIQGRRRPKKLQTQVADGTGRSTTPTSTMTTSSASMRATRTRGT